MNARVKVAEPDIGDEEIAAVTGVLRSGRLAAGPEVERFENEFADYIGVHHAVAVSNGTAALFAADEKVFTLSVHGANNYPFRKPPSDLDIELDDGTEDEVYLDAVDLGLRTAMASRPDLCFFIAGADPFEGDRLGRLSVSKPGLAERDRRVFEACASAGVPLVIVMSGGYAEHVEDTVDIHESTVRGLAGAVTSGGVGAR